MKVYASNGNFIGNIVNRTLYKVISGSRHYYRKGGFAVGMDSKAFDESSHQYDRIVFKDIDTGRQYGIDTKIFKDLAFTVNYGEHCKQYVVRLKNWKRVESTESA